MSPCPILTIVSVLVGLPRLVDCALFSVFTSHIPPTTEEHHCPASCAVVRDGRSAASGRSGMVCGFIGPCLTIRVPPTLRTIVAPCSARGAVRGLSLLRFANRGSARLDTNGAVLCLVTRVVDAFFFSPHPHALPLASLPRSSSVPVHSCLQLSRYTRSSSFGGRTFKICRS